MSWHVTANEINQWSISHSREAQEILPEIIKRLVLATLKVTYIHIPSGDSILTGGWDGVVEVEEGNEFVPKGKSFWEFGTNRSINQKAQSDYDKRTTTQADENITYLFATTKTWAKKSEFEIEKTEEKRWKLVRGLNADDLETWLFLAPSVHTWFAQLIGKKPLNAVNIESALDKWKNKTRVKLSSKLVLISREEEIDKLIASLEEKASEIIVISQNEEESFIFTLASLENKKNLASRALVVYSQDEWNILLQSKYSLILIPQKFTPSDIGQAVTNGHTVISFSERTEIKSSKYNEVELSKISKEQKREVLETMGLSYDKAWHLLEDTKGFLHTIVKHPYLEPFSTKNPIWVDNYDINILSTLLFINSWNRTNQYDIKIIEELSENRYEELEKELFKLQVEKEAPFRLIGNTWQVISKISLWDLIANKISEFQIDKLEIISLKIFSEIDPKFYVEAENRWMAYDTHFNYSGLIRESLADTLCLLSVFGENQLNYSSNINHHISQWLNTLYNQNLDVESWYSYGHELLLLAEASPNSFLSVFKKSLNKKNSKIEKLFESGNSIMGSCFHCNLLWALERISWNTQYISNVVEIFAKLSKLQIESNMGNQPFNSLKDIFLGWKNNSSLTYTEKISIIENVLIKKEQEVAWKLLISLLPDNHSMSSGINTPKYNTWNEEYSNDILQDDYYNYNNEINRLIIESFELNIDKRINIIENIDKFNDEKYILIIDFFCSLDKNIFNEQEKLQLATAMRHIIHNHRKYGDGSWAMSSSKINKLEEAFIFIEPEKLIYKYKYLFDEYSPEILEPKSGEDDFETENRKSDSLRKVAISKIIAQGDFKSFTEFIEKTSYSNIIARLIVDGKFEKYNKHILSWINSENKKQFSFFKEYIGQLYFQNKINVNEFLEHYNDTEKVHFLISLPFDEKIFQLIQLQNENIKQDYWQDKDMYIDIKSQDSIYIQELLGELKKYKRPMKAIEIFSNMIFTKDEFISIELNLLYETLIDIATQDNGETLNNYRIENVAMYFLKYSNDKEKKKDLEFLFINFNKILPFNIEKDIAVNPELFVELISYIYKPSNSEREDENLTLEQLRNRANNAKKVIDKIRLIPRIDNCIDFEVLKQWMSQVIKLFKERDREVIGYQMIGQYLATAPNGEDGTWPHEVVREIFELFYNDDIEIGFLIGKQNQRGMVWRASGGEQEYALAENYRNDAQSMKFTYPNTFQILNKMAYNYEIDGRREDMEEELK